ncbi:MAG TPA: bifunctional phosphoglucose/phosphomannose isomerase [Candidatus Dojkabacteria bacterium]|jgi:glucose/mannose-6-phosphate isomerase|nr:bifunctional phosphoglucose/phosphomannose isomerase [Candidatus Dojkabacteria bacterium]
MPDCPGVKKPVSYRYIKNTVMNDRYYMDIKKFPQQFKKGAELAKDIKVEGEFKRIILCGMGGSSFYAHILNDLFAKDAQIPYQIETVKTYDLPDNADSSCLFILSSVSGNTEEVLSCYDKVDSRGYKYFVVTAGGELLERAKQRNAPTVVVPLETQPRLLTGYLMVGVLKVLTNSGLIPDKFPELAPIFDQLDSLLDEEYAKKIAKDLYEKVPLIIGCDNIPSAAMFTKIKFNENSKMQSYWNVFPEVNHNEMVGYTNLIMPAYFLILKSKFTHPRIHKRIEIFKNLMKDKGAGVEVIELKGESFFAELMYMHYLADHISYYLADEYKVDPEPVEMVEEFKKLLNQ